MATNPFNPLIITLNSRTKLAPRKSDVTRVHTYEDKGVSFNELNTDSPQEWVINCEGMEESESVLIDDHFAEVGISTPFEFLDRDDYIWMVYYKSEPNVSHTKVWNQKREFSLIWYPGGDAPTVLDTTAPTTISDLTYSSKTTSSITFTFTTPTDAVGVTGYQVSTDNGSTWSALTVTGTTTKTGTASNLTQNTSYTIKVRAYDASLNYATASNGITQTTNTLTTISDLTYSSKTGNSITCTFTDQSDETGYQISKDNGSTWANVSTTGTTTRTVVATGLSTSTAYTIKVRSYDAKSGTPNYSSASNGVTQTTDAGFWATIGSNLSNNGDDSLNIDSNTTTMTSRISYRLTAIGDYIEWTHDNANGYFVNGTGGGILYLGINDTIYTTSGGDNNTTFTSSGSTPAASNGDTCRIEIDGTNHLILKVAGSTVYTSSFTLSPLNAQIGFYFYSGTVNADIAKPTVKSGGVTY